LKKADDSLQEIGSGIAMQRTFLLRRYQLGVLLGLWLSLLFWLLFLLTNHKMTPGESPSNTANWPEQSHLVLAPEVPTLLFFAHPQCPCTRASLSSLRIVMSKFAGRVKVYTLFYEPKGAEASWLQTDTVNVARELAGLDVLADQEGAEAKLFDAQTSGQVLLFSTKGELLFQGGITPSRGHNGDNPQLDALLSLLKAEELPEKVVKGPVFGCPLQEEP
jgi:hypothetical protein